MKIEFLVPVVTTGKPPRAKNTKTILGSVRRTVEIPEYSLDEAPLAVRCGFRGDEDYDGNQVNYRDFRQVDETLYIDLTKERALGLAQFPGRIQKWAYCEAPFKGVGGFIMDAVEKLPRNTIFPSDVGNELGRQDGFHGKLPLLDEMGIADLDMETVERCIALFDREVAQLAFIDGSLHQQERSPALEVVYSGYDGKVRISPVRRDGEKPLSVYNDEDQLSEFRIALFRMDQMNEAVAFAGSISQKFSNPHEFYVADFANVDFDAASASVRAVAVHMNDMISDLATGRLSGLSGRDLLDRLSPRVMEIYERMERELPDGDDENVSEELAAAAESVLDLPLRQRVMFTGERDEDRDEKIVKIYQQVFDLWHNRVINGMNLPGWERPFR